MPTKQWDLLKIKRFFPLFITQFLGAFNDNLYKNALVIFITYNLSNELHLNAEILITVAYGIFILPFFLFSSIAGELADKLEKSILIRYTKLAEIILMVLAGIGLYLHSIPLLMVTLFLIGVQATFFGPLKYAILPDHLKTEELIAGNALIESGTFLGILLGTILGGMLATIHGGSLIISILLLLIAIGGYIASFCIPPAKSAAPQLTLNINFVRESWKIVQHTFTNRILFLCILGISWFWLIGGTYLSQFPTYAKDVLGAKASVVTLFLTVFTAGIGVGSLFCNKLLKGKIHATYVPLAALGMTFFAIDLVFASKINFAVSTQLITVPEFLTHFNSWRIIIDLFLLSLCGGIYIVPLYAILQHESDQAHRSRAFAANNIINALFMVFAAIATSIMLYLHFSITHVFLVIALANLIVAIYICNLLPEALAKSCLIWLFKTLYRAEVRGLENYYQAGKRVLIIPNHTSFLDAALLAALLPQRLTFAINTQVAKKWWMKLLLKLVNTYPIDPTKPFATKALIDYLRNDHHVVIFPEGRITVTGSLMKIYEGPGLIADKAQATLLPIRIEGAQYTPFSHLKGKVRIRWFPKITITILEPTTFDLPETATKHQRRELISAKLYDIMTNTAFLSGNLQETLFQSLLNAKKIHGDKHIVLEDIERKPVNFSRLILSSITLGCQLAKMTEPNEYVGIMLPNSVANVITFFAMQAYHRVPAMLNFSTGIQSLLSACKTAKLKFICTSKKFIELANLYTSVEALKANGFKIIYLEDITSKINIFDKILGKLQCLFPQCYYHFINKMNKTNITEMVNSPAVILFTSGSEGTPKGVVLSHLNLQSNRFQLSARIDFSPTDRIFNALPMFHSFGLNSATLLPIVSGMRVFMYPSPLHYKIVPELCYDTNSTIFFGTDTFLLNYAKYAHPYNFYSLRYVFAGAEKLRDQTRHLWMEKFGIRIMEGYGATEASPVIAMNTPMQYKLGTVGRLLPGMIEKREPVPGITQGERFFVKGPNIMLGYMLSETPGKIVPPFAGWHDTGDIVTIDQSGYISIKGRAKRFAKIAGEMVSLAAVEEEMYNLWPKYQHAVLSLPDERKGEQIVLASNYKEAELSAIISHFKSRGMGEISLPRKIVTLPNLPLLGSGKIDYQATKMLVNERL